MENITEKVEVILSPITNFISFPVCRCQLLSPSLYAYTHTNIKVKILSSSLFLHYVNAILILALFCNLPVFTKYTYAVCPIFMLTTEQSSLILIEHHLYICILFHINGHLFNFHFLLLSKTIL